MEKDCSEFIEELRNCEGTRYELFYRGFKEKIIDFKKIERLKNRIPRDSPTWLHNYADKELSEMFGWTPRSNGVFATTNKTDAKRYSTNIVGVGSDSSGPFYDKSTEPYLYFPIGKYKYVFNPEIDDLYVEFESKELFPETDEYIITVILGYDDYDENVYSKEKIEKINKEVEDFKELQQFNIDNIFNDYQDHNLSDSYNENVEVIFDCDEYYLIDIHFLDDIKKYIYHIS